MNNSIMQPRVLLLKYQDIYLYFSLFAVEFFCLTHLFEEEREEKASQRKKEMSESKIESI